MSITVADCLKLSSLKEAEVLGGHKGLHKPVSCVSVLEDTDLSGLADVDVSQRNKMMISAFVSIKHDVEAQCRIIQRLHDMEEASLILYHVGIYVPNVDAKLIQLADKLDFPLIMMPPNLYSHRYSEVISDVMRAIINDQRRETNIVSDTLDQIAQMKPRMRNIGAAMRILSDRLRCTLLLADQNGGKRAFASWPAGAAWDENQLLSIIELRQSETPFGELIERTVNGKKARIYCQTLDTERQKRLLLFGIDENNNISRHDLEQAVEVLQLFANIWKDGFAGDGPDALVRAILGNQPGEIRRIARLLYADVEAINAMWVLWDKGKSGANITNNKDWLATRLTGFLKENHTNVFVDVLENYIVALVGSARDSALEDQLEKQFMTETATLKSGWVLFNCSRLSTTEEIRAAFLLMEENVETACRIYPLKNVFTQNELRFTQKCRAILDGCETEVKKALCILEPLLGDETGRDTIKTLAVYLLDCQGSIVEASARLYVHKNTVKYRLKKAQDALGFEVLKMPGMMDMYVALALDRLLP